MELKIKELKLQNFKGQKELGLLLNEDLTSIHGTNGAGKSTLCDAWMWLLTGKDNKDRSDFEIKTRNDSGEIEHRLEHSVSAMVEADGIKYDFARIYKEQWVKPTGEKEQVLKSHTTDFIWDTIPLSKKSEYDMRVNHLFGDIERFKLLSNPRYFLNMDWKKRRSLLMQLAAVTDESVMKQLADSNEDFSKMLSELNNNSLEDFRKKLNADKKELRKKIDEIPVKIREATLAIPIEPDYIAIDKEIKTEEIKYSSIEAEISDINKAFEAQSKSIREQQNVILAKETHLVSMENTAKLKAVELNNEEGKRLNELNLQLIEVETSIRSFNSDQALVINRIHQKEADIEYQNLTLVNLRDEYSKINELIFDETKVICPACNQNLPDDDIKEFIRKFNADKEARLQDNIRKGKHTKELIEILSNQLVELIAQKDEVASKIHSANEDKTKVENDIQKERNREKTSHSWIDLLACNLEYDGFKQEIEVIKSQIIEIKSPDVSELNSKKSEIRKSIDALKEQLSVRKIADNQKRRIVELEEELKALSQELATLEGKEFIADQFNRSKIESIENGINGLFETVRWRMFRPLINGGEEECCEAILSCGNLYEAANNASQINAGIECINTLSNFYDMYLPVFLDNSESIVELTHSKSQIIRLVVDGNYKQLTVI